MLFRIINYLIDIMNNQILQVNVIPVEDNFVHLSSKLIRQLNILEKHDHPVRC